MKNWYFFYDSSGFSQNGIKELSKELESQGFRYERCTELGAGPGTEQIVLWLHSHQYISGILTGVVSNYIYDILKNLYKWYKDNPNKKKTIPIVQFFITFKDSKSKRLRAELSFRFDRPAVEEETEKSFKHQTEYLDMSSEIDQSCSKCGAVIHPHTVYYIATEEASEIKPVCIFCK